MFKSLVALAAVALTLSAPLPQQSAAQASVVPGVHAVPVDDELNLDFTLVNATGYDIAEVRISPASEESWGDNILEDGLADGEAAELSFHPDADAALWDLRITWADDDGSVFWRKLNLTEISKLTLKYDDETGKTTAVKE
ncbi:MAG: hypothetical protein ACO1RX_12800 [Candidatus Sericytochromatia bacterium]